MFDFSAFAGRHLITRFAPSPTGRLHIGHAYSALFAYELAKQSGGRFILRFEDIDPERCRPAFGDDILEDLAWLGLDWQTPVRRQSEHFADYRHALDRLDAQGLLYPCFCTRREIQEEIQRSGSAPHGPEGALYPGTCRRLSDAERQVRLESGAPYALRLHVERAAALAGPLTWRDQEKGVQTATPQILGDVVLARKDAPASYHLCVTVDDHLQGITMVSRAADLFYATHLHRLLQEVLELATPDYYHHPLLLDPEGKRFAKRNKSVTLRELRETGSTPDDIRRLIQTTPTGVPT